MAGGVKGDGIRDGVGGGKGVEGSRGEGEGRVDDPAGWDADAWLEDEV